MLAHMPVWISRVAKGRAHADLCIHMCIDKCGDMCIDMCACISRVANGGGNIVEHRFRSLMFFAMFSHAISRMGIHVALV